MELIDNRNIKLKDDLASELKSGSKMSVAAVKSLEKLYNICYKVVI